MCNRKEDKYVLASLVSLEGLEVLEVGAGTGHLIDFLLSEGARPTGIEPSDAQVALSAQMFPETSGRVYSGFAQTLDFARERFDLVVFFNSLHHVPQELMSRALVEAVRVLKPSGLVYIAEPLCEGPCYELHAPIDDERVVRTAALAQINDSASVGLKKTKEYCYATSYAYTSFKEFIDDLLRIEHSRIYALEEHRSALEELFYSLGRKEADAYWFDQPMRVNILSKSIGGE